MFVSNAGKFSEFFPLQRFVAAAVQVVSQPIGAKSLPGCH